MEDSLSVHMARNNRETDVSELAGSTKLLGVLVFHVYAAVDIDLLEVVIFLFTQEC